VGVSLFSGPATSVNIALLPTSADTPVLTDVLISCATTSDARLANRGVDATVPGVGDQARWLSRGYAGGGRFYALVWRKDHQLGIVSVAGPTTDQFIGAELAESLARRAAARSKPGP
jgi:hypothetical protein